MLDRHAPALCLLLSWGCGWLSSQPDDPKPSSPDAGVSDGGTPPLPDAGRDGGNDAGTPPDDGGPPPDAATCTGDPPAATSCAVPVCTAALVWELVEAPEGTFCTELETHRCVDGACVLRVCGDGFREPAAAGELREGCDDGNDVDDDGCSNSCEPQVRNVSSLDAGDFTLELATPGVPSIGIDGDGRGLFVWTTTTDRQSAVYARRLDRRGNFLDETPLILVERVNGEIADPAVTGLEGGGWAVAWIGAASVSVPLAAMARVVNPDGSLGVARSLGDIDSRPTQTRVRIAALGSGFVAAWTDLAVRGPRSGIRARTFTASGAPLGPVLNVSTGPHDERTPDVAADGSGWIVLWQQFSAEASRVMGRRYDGTTPLDAEQFEVSHTMVNTAPDVVANEGGGFTGLWIDNSGRVGPRKLFTRTIETSATGELVLGVVDEIDTEPLDQASGALGAAPLPDGHVLAGWVSSLPDRFRYGASEGFVAPDELDVLTGLEIRPADTPSLSASHDGVWIAWTQENLGSEPRNSLHLFHLPVD